MTTMSLKNSTFKVDILKTCKTCSEPIDKISNKRMRSYCSAECRSKYHNKKRWDNGGRERQIERVERGAKDPHPNKKKCGICGLWWKRVGCHVINKHKVTAREYKEFMGLPVSHGIMTENGREHMSKLAYENKMDEQLKEVGKGTRFTKGDPRTKESNPLAGKKFEHSEYY